MPTQVIDIHAKRERQLQEEQDRIKRDYDKCLQEIDRKLHESERLLQEALDLALRAKGVSPHSDEARKHRKMVQEIGALRDHAKKASRAVIRR